MDLNGYVEKESNKVLLYGRAKVGKSALVGKLAEKFTLHWIDLEDGIKTLLNPDYVKPEWRKNIHVTRVPDTQTIPMAIETVLKVIKGDECRICFVHGKVACVVCSKDASQTPFFTTIHLKAFTSKDILVIDSVTQLSLSAMNAVIKGELQKDNWEYRGTFNDYRAQGFMLDRIFGTMQAGNFNCCAISHEALLERKQDTQGGGGKDAVGDNVFLTAPVAGTRNFSRNFARYFDTVVYVDIVNKKHKAFSSTTYDGGTIAGSRKDVKIEDVKGDETVSLLKLFERKVVANVEIKSESK